MVVLHVAAADVIDVAVALVEAPEAQRRHVGVQRPQPLAEVPLGDGGVDLLGGAGGRRARRVGGPVPHGGEASVGVVEVGLLLHHVGVNGHDSSPGGAVTVVSRAVPSPIAGRLLVATPLLGDPNFDRTVVLMLEHSDEGALGVVLNRPSEIDLAGSLPHWDTLAAPPSVVFVGGPVSQGAVIALARVQAETDTEAWSRVLPRVGVLDLTLGLESLGVEVEEVRVFTGYSGWGPGQLEGEIDEGAWFVVDADPSDAMVEDPDALWSAVLKRQGGELAKFALYPRDPSVN